MADVQIDTLTIEEFAKQFLAWLRHATESGLDELAKRIMEQGRSEE